MALYEMRDKSWKIGLPVVIFVIVISLIYWIPQDRQPSILNRDGELVFSSFGYEAKLESDSCESLDTLSLFSDDEIDEIREKEQASNFGKPVNVYFTNTSLEYESDDPYEEGAYSIEINDGSLDVNIDEACFDEKLRNRVQWAYNIRGDVPSFSKFYFNVKEVEGYFRIYVDFIAGPSIPQWHLLMNRWNFYEDPNLGFGTYPLSVRESGEKSYELELWSKTHTVDWSQVGAVMISVSGYGHLKLGAIKLISE